MAGCAVGAGLFQLVAIHAAAHGQIGLDGKLIALRDRSVTFPAGVVFFQMCSVAKNNEGGKLIHGYPRYRAVPARKGR